MTGASWNINSVDETVGSDLPSTPSLWLRCTQGLSFSKNNMVHITSASGGETRSRLRQACGYRAWQVCQHQVQNLHCIPAADSLQVQRSAAGAACCAANPVNGSTYGVMRCHALRARRRCQAPVGVTVYLQADMQAQCVARRWVCMQTEMAGIPDSLALKQSV